MLGLYGLGIFLALAVAFILRRTAFKGPKAPLLMELPTYKWPSLRNLGLGLLERSKLFVRRAGTVILSLSVLLWALSSFPGAPSDAKLPAIHYSYAGQIGHALEPLIQPIGFDWRIGIALVPGFAAREVMVSALATVYAIETAKGGGGGGDEGITQALGTTLSSSWSLATALSLLLWYVIAPQCLSTIAVVRRETNSWKLPLFLLVYLTSFAYLACFGVYRWACWMGWG
jgi:ferrous iron transport protein B